MKTLERWKWKRRESECRQKDYEESNVLQGSAVSWPFSTGKRRALLNDSRNETSRFECSIGRGGACGEETEQYVSSLLSGGRTARTISILYSWFSRSILFMCLRKRFPECCRYDLLCLCRDGGDRTAISTTIRPRNELYHTGRLLKSMEKWTNGHTCRKVHKEMLWCNDFGGTEEPRPTRLRLDDKNNEACGQTCFKKNQLLDRILCLHEITENSSYISFKKASCKIRDIGAKSMKNFLSEDS